MGLYHSTYVGYGFEIPATVDFDQLDAVITDQPDAELLGRVWHQYVGDFERLFLLTACEEVKENAVVRIESADFTRPETGGWIAALHNIAVRLGHAEHPLPTWLVLHDYS
jgi:hypothetical protein